MTSPPQSTNNRHRSVGVLRDTGSVVQSEIEKLLHGDKERQLGHSSHGEALVRPRPSSEHQFVIGVGVALVSVDFTARSIDPDHRLTMPKDRTSRFSESVHVCQARGYIKHDAVLVEDCHLTGRDVHHWKFQPGIVL